MMKQLRVGFVLATTVVFSSVALAEQQPENLQEGRGYLNAIQGNTVYIDRRPYSILQQTRQGETLSDRSEAQWQPQVEFAVGDEVLYGTINEDTTKLDFILRRLK